MHVAAVLLAAGAGRRLAPETAAAKKDSKLLLPLGGEPVVARVIAALRDGGAADPLIVVTGHAAAAVEAAARAAAPNCHIAHNADHTEGMASSLRAGLAAVPADCAGALIALADMPGLRGEHVRALIDAFTATQGHKIIAPTSGGRRGNPVLWPRACFTELAAVRGDTGGRGVLARHAADLRLVALDHTADGGRGVLDDLDTPEALREWLKGSTKGG